MPAPKRRKKKGAPRRPARRKTSSENTLFAWGLLAFGALLVLAGLTGLVRLLWGSWSDEEDGERERSVEVLATGYCNCEICCSWATNETGQAVYAYGKMKGRPKVVGLTCTGRQARRGTIAADPRLFAFGTKIIVPGYGPGVVEDIGGAIKGRHIDLWFPTHREAREWGRRTLTVTVYED